MTKKELLAGLEQEMIGDSSLPLQESRLVFGEGNADAEVLFIGEAPGFHEDRLGRPFVGRGGELLTECIKSIGWHREQVYITNIVKRRPPENRDPLPEEIEVYKPYLARQIEIISPRIIVPLGRFAMNYFLPDAKISRDQGKTFIVDDKKIVPMFHPAAALRGTTVLNQFKETFAKLPAIVSGEVEVIKPEVAQTKKSSEEDAPQVSLF
ncbi:MAG: uracil-DNA glycosylase [Candidatus Ryanbacteria bacterium]|nr:uracil-DNA glycosylase [Candidatus Ryanbacteria bacterium]